MNDSDYRSANAIDSKKKTPAEWARFWFARLAKFHKVHDPSKWRFSESDVIAFLQTKKKAGMPTWKRLMVVKGLVLYRNQFMKSHEPRLEDIRATLQRWVLQEREREVAPKIEEVVGKINPREPDVIQALRRMLRVHGKAYNTEKAYVKWVRRFMKVRGVKNLADFQAMEARARGLRVHGIVPHSTRLNSVRGEIEPRRTRRARRQDELPKRRDKWTKFECKPPCESTVMLLRDSSSDWVGRLGRGANWGATWAHGRSNYDDLHARFSPAGGEGAKPAGLALAKDVIPYRATSGKLASFRNV